MAFPVVPADQMSRSGAAGCRSETASPRSIAPCVARRQHPAPTRPGRHCGCRGSARRSGVRPRFPAAARRQRLQRDVAGEGQRDAERAGRHIRRDLRANAGHRRHREDQKRCDDDSVDHRAMGRPAPARHAGGAGRPPPSAPPINSARRSASSSALISSPPNQPARSGTVTGASTIDNTVTTSGTAPIEPEHACHRRRSARWRRRDGEHHRERELRSKVQGADRPHRSPSGQTTMTIAGRSTESDGRRSVRDDGLPSIRSKRAEHDQEDRGRHQADARAPRAPESARPEQDAEAPAMSVRAG